MHYLMQARSSTDGLLYTWTSEEPDFSAAGYAGPGLPQEIAILQRPPGGGAAGLRVLASDPIPNSVLPAGSSNASIALFFLATSPGPALVVLTVPLELAWVTTPPSDFFLSFEVMRDGDPLDPPLKWRFGMFPTMGNFITTCTLFAPIDIEDATEHSYSVKATANANTTTTLGSGVDGLFAIVR